MNYDQAIARCWAEIDLDVVASNYATARRVCGDRTQVIPVLKANAYGLGAAKLAHFLAREGAELFAVADLYEALEVQNASGQDALVLGLVPPAQMELAVENRVVCTVFSLDLARALSQTAARLGETARVHIKVDTGLHRLGLDAGTALDEAREIFRLPNLRVEGLFTHLALRNKEEDDLQIARLLGVADGLRAEGLDYGILHAGDSIGMVRYPEYRFDAVRSGAWLYGVVPNRCPNPEDCRPPVRFLTRVAQVRRVKKGECLGYDDEHPLPRDSVIATLSAGYADGYPRMNNAGAVIVRGRRAPIVGLMCMDQMFIDVTDAPGVEPGDPVTLIGPDIWVTEVATWTHANRNELLARIGRRVPRVYLRSGKVEDICGEGEPPFSEADGHDPTAGVFLDGLVRMAAGCSRGIGPSYMRACCYVREEGLAAFARDYGIDAADVRLDPPRASLAEVLTGWMGDADAPIASELVRLMGLRLGKCLSVRTLAEDSDLRDRLGGDEGGGAPFWFLEDICFAEFERGLACLMLGNDE